MPHIHRLCQPRAKSATVSSQLDRQNTRQEQHSDVWKQMAGAILGSRVLRDDQSLRRADVPRATDTHVPRRMSVILYARVKQHCVGKRRGTGRKTGAIDETRRGIAGGTVLRAQCRDRTCEPRRVHGRHSDTDTVEQHGARFLNDRRRK